MSRSIVECIDRDHERLIQFIARLGSPSRGRESLGNKLRTLCVAHLRAETAVACCVVGHDGYAASEQRALRNLDPLAAGATDPRFQADLQAWLGEHIVDVRCLIIARLRAESGEGRLEQLAAAYEHRMAIEAAALRPVRGTPRRLDRSRTELYEQARSAAIIGRAGMTREELIEALQQGAARMASPPHLSAKPTR